MLGSVQKIPLVWVGGLTNMHRWGFGWGVMSDEKICWSVEKYCEENMPGSGAPLSLRHAALRLEQVIDMQINMIAITALVMYHCSTTQLDVTCSMRLL